MLRFTVVALLGLAFTAQIARPGEETAPQIAHMVYFTLKENTPEAKKKLVAACKKYLKDHEGVTFFATGTRAEAFKREVNDTDWDVSLHVVFKNKAAHDKYQVAKTHLQFIAENKDNWKKVRVFDTDVDGQ
jgi:hypothetical protein